VNLWSTSPVQLGGKMESICINLCDMVEALMYKRNIRPTRPFPSPHIVADLRKNYPVDLILDQSS